MWSEAQYRTVANFDSKIFSTMIPYAAKVDNNKGQQTLALGETAK